MDDEKEWIETCQRILRAQTSMDFKDFLEFLRFKEKNGKRSELITLRELVTVVSERLNFCS